MPGVLPWPGAHQRRRALAHRAALRQIRFAEGEREGRPEMYEQFKDLTNLNSGSNF
jgi:hypothetical protein